MPVPIPPPLRDMVRDHASFGEIEAFIEQLPIPEERRAALWLWARFGLPPEYELRSHRELERRLAGTVR